MSYPDYEEDAFTLGKNALANVADLGASRAGKLVVEITSNLLNLNQEGSDNEYLKWHLKALFTEFVTGEDYDLPYYNKPREPKTSWLDSEPGCDQVEITRETIGCIKNSILRTIAEEALDQGEKNWLDKRHMGDDVKITCTNINSTGQCQGCKVCWVKAQKGLMPPHPPNTHYMNDPNCKCSSCKSLQPAPTEPIPLYPDSIGKKTKKLKMNKGEITTAVIGVLFIIMVIVAALW